MEVMRKTFLGSGAKLTAEESYVNPPQGQTYVGEVWNHNARTTDNRRYVR